MSSTKETINEIVLVSIIVCGYATLIIYLATIKGLMHLEHGCEKGQQIQLWSDKVYKCEQIQVDTTQK
jgi:hypothetical protein